MKKKELQYCPCTLAEGFDTYSPTGSKLMFGGKKVSHILDFDAPEMDETVAEKLRQNSKQISISGAQFKQSLILEKNKLRLTESGEPGHYILKPIPFRPAFGRASELPANEHLTMQIARQAYKLNTAPCALVFFKNGEPAYITKRFDYTADGSKTPQEDFASILGRTKELFGEDYKNEGSYEEIAQLMSQNVAAYPVEIEKFFELVLFNYLFNNGDAHLKNFSLQQPLAGDYLLSPAYDLINTRIHIPDEAFFALKNGLFADDADTESFQSLGFYAYDDFLEFGKKIGIRERRAIALLNKFRTPNPTVNELTSHSYLTKNVKKLYLEM
ncbi:MAG: HipA domain-containing protein, partial [Bacteroidia bacterium]|nr:HipA domain-containing protein [Bacteroidia bacterium]